MASSKAKVKIALPSVESTTVECAGCAETLNLLDPHLTIMLKPERAVIVNQPRSEYEAIVRGEERTPEEILAAGDVDEEEESVNYLGWRSGAGEHVKLHNYDCLIAFAEQHSDEPVKIKFFRPDGNHYETVGRSSE